MKKYILVGWPEIQDCIQDGMNVYFVVLFQGMKFQIQLM